MRSVTGRTRSYSRLRPVFRARDRPSGEREQFFTNITTRSNSVPRKYSYLNNEGEINGEFGEARVIIRSFRCFFFCLFRFVFFFYSTGRGKCRAQLGYLYVWLLTIADETRMLKQSRGCRWNRKFRGELAFNVSARAHLNGTLDK